MVLAIILLFVGLAVCRVLIVAIRMIMALIISITIVRLLVVVIKLVALMVVMILVETMLLVAQFMAMHGWKMSLLLFFQLLLSLAIFSRMPATLLAA